MCPVLFLGLNYYWLPLAEKKCIVDFKLSPWFEYCIFSFGYFPRRHCIICRRFGTMCRFHLQRLEVDCRHIIHWRREIPKRKYTRNVLFCHCIFHTSVTFTPAVFPLLSVCNVLIVPRTCSTPSVFSFPYYYRYNCTSDVTPCSLVGSYRCFGASYCTTVVPLNTFLRKLCVVYHDTGRHYMEDSNVHWHHPENLEFYVSHRCKISGRITVWSVLIFTALTLRWLMSYIYIWSTHSWCF